MYAYIGLHDSHDSETKHNDMGISLAFGGMKFIGNW
jgi:hypothetical protein